MKLMTRIDKFLFSIEKAFIALILFGMVALSCLQIVLRNVFSYGIPSADIILRHLNLGIAFLGASMATREGKHLRIDVIPRMITGRIGKLISFFTYGVSVFVCLILTRAGWSFVALEMQTEAQFAFDIPLWIAKAIIPFGFLLISFRLILKMVEQAYALVSGRDSPSPEKDGDAE